MRKHIYLIIAVSVIVVLILVFGILKYPREIDDIANFRPGNIEVINASYDLLQLDEDMYNKELTISDKKIILSVINMLKECKYSKKLQLITAHTSTTYAKIYLRFKYDKRYDLITITEQGEMILHRDGEKTYKIIGDTGELIKNLSSIFKKSKSGL